MTVKKWSVWFVFALFIALRLLLAFRLPIFNDESIYMHWGWGFLQSPDRWWAFMLDGKQPGVAISFGLAQQLPFDPLLSMRLLSIGWSCISFWTVYALWKRLTHQRSFTIVGLLLACCPYLILFDTLALAESAVTASFAMLLFLSLSLSQNPKIWKGLAIGAVIAWGWWFKSTVLLSLPLIVLTLILYRKTWGSQWKKVLLGLVLGGLIGFVMVAPVLFNPNIDYKNTAVIQRTLPLKDVLAFPWQKWVHNWIAAGSWSLAYGGPILCCVFLVALWKLRQKKETLLLALWIIVPVVIETTLLTSLSGRLLAISVIPMIILAALWLSSQRLPIGPLRLGEASKAGLTILLYSLLIGSVLWGGLLSVSPLGFFHALKPLPPAQGDFSQYVTSWPSGYGVKEAVELLVRESQKNKIIVFVRLDSGNPEDAVIAYLEREKIPVFYLQQINDITKIKEIALLDWYFVSRGPQYGGMEKYLTQIAKFKKPLDEEFIGVYKINP